MSSTLEKAIILTALPIEYEAVKKHLKNIKEVEHPNGTIYETGEFETNAGTCSVSIAQVEIGNINAAAGTERMLEFFSPQIAIFVGVAGGIKDVEIGDVVIASRVDTYESGKADDEFLSRPNTYIPTHRLYHRALAVARKTDWRDRCGDGAIANAVHGPIAAGEKVISSTKSETIYQIKKHHNDVIAVEMEGSGFLGATRAHTGVEAIVIRGISDLLNNKEASDKMGSQILASNHASAFAFQVLSEFTLSQQSRTAQQDNVPQTYARLIESTVDLCGLKHWESWTSWVLAPKPCWREKMVIGIQDYRKQVLAAVWPGLYPELERSIKTLSIALGDALDTFLLHHFVEGNLFLTDNFHHDPCGDRQKLSREFKEWVIKCQILIFESTRAVNWFAEVVRKEVDPRFFEEGKFLVTYGPNDDYATSLLEYNCQEKSVLPAGFRERINNIVEQNREI